MSQRIILRIEGREIRHHARHREVIVAVAAMGNMPPPSGFRGMEVQIGQGGMHHVDIMRVLRGTFIGARVARDETGAHAVLPRSSGWQVAAVAECNLKIAQLIGGR